MGFVNLIAVIAAALTLSVTAQSPPPLTDLVLKGRHYLDIPVPHNGGAYTYAVWMKLEKDNGGADNPVLFSQFAGSGIKNATYFMMDVTERVRGLVRDGWLRINGGFNSYSGDPAPWLTPKSLRIFLDDGTSHTFLDGNNVTLAVPNSRFSGTI